MSPANLQLRLANATDLPAIVAIYNSIVAGRMVTADLEPVTVESRRAWFEAHQTPNRPLWVLTDPAVNHAVCAWASFDSFYLRAAYDGTVMVALYLAESYRGRGLGGWLLDELIARALPRHPHVDRLHFRPQRAQPPAFPPPRICRVGAHARGGGARRHPARSHRARPPRALKISSSAEIGQASFRCASNTPRRAKLS